MLQFWAWKRDPIEVGVLIPTAGIKIEYWMITRLEPVPDDHDPTIYLRALKE
jgi:hypothetical protein